MDDFSISLNDIKKDLGKKETLDSSNDFDFISNDIEEVTPPKKNVTSPIPKPLQPLADDEINLSLENNLELNTIEELILFINE